MTSEERKIFSAQWQKPHQRDKRKVNPFLKIIGNILKIVKRRTYKNEPKDKKFDIYAECVLSER